MDSKKIVIPGTLLSENPARAGSGTFVSGGKVYASVCGFVSEKDKIFVLPFSGPYLPKKYDLVIGYVTVVTPSNWIFDIGCPYEALLHVSEYPIRVPSEEMQNHFNVGDTVLLKVVDVNAEMKIEVTYKGDLLCKKLKTGRIYDIPVSKVSRVIGRSGSMIAMLKTKTGCEIFVGNNGRIWMNGSLDDMEILSRALLKIERDARLSGLTDLVAAFIDEQYALLGGVSSNPAKTNSFDASESGGSFGISGGFPDDETVSGDISDDFQTQEAGFKNKSKQKAAAGAFKSKRPGKVPAKTSHPGKTPDAVKTMDTEELNLSKTGASKHTPPKSNFKKPVKTSKTEEEPEESFPPSGSVSNKPAGKMKKQAVRSLKKKPVESEVMKISN
ncbi:exosome complex RNA-binding protein Rrp4 [Methanolapillus ohkumae]|uniref:Exosome complex component Rrp4 n=1 Tax=Methanolapillus ohkumae TaxID=3028298 RepID=A0AA96V790_9EURY|nr:hypothetical protein MsAm2_06610 [Methanosarcinaceae archaeon Am2]